MLDKVYIKSLTSCVSFIMKYISIPYLLYNVTNIDIVYCKFDQSVPIHYAVYTPSRSSLSIPPPPPTLAPSWLPPSFPISPLIASGALPPALRPPPSQAPGAIPPFPISLPAEKLDVEAGARRGPRRSARAEVDAAAAYSSWPFPDRCRWLKPPSLAAPEIPPSLRGGGGRRLLPPRGEDPNIAWIRCPSCLIWCPDVRIWCPRP
jgi:hypothetical protein